MFFKKADEFGYESPIGSINFEKVYRSIDRHCDQTVRDRYPRGGSNITRLSEKIVPSEMDKSNRKIGNGKILVGVDASRAAVYVYNGYFPKQFLVLLPFMLVIGVLGTYLGKLILKHTSENIFRYMVLGIIILTAVLQMIRYFKH